MTAGDGSTRETDATDTEGYVHEPGSIDDDGTDTPTQPRNAPRPDGEFDWRGWVLVCAVVVAFLVVPGVLYLLPMARGAVADLGLGWRTTYLVLPLLPALVLGVVAVWAAVRSRAG